MRLLILIISIVLSSCSLINQVDAVKPGLTPIFSSIQEALDWETNHITYKTALEMKTSIIGNNAIVIIEEVE